MDDFQPWGASKSDRCVFRYIVDYESLEELVRGKTFDALSAIMANFFIILPYMDESI